MSLEDDAIDVSAGKMNISFEVEDFVKSHS